MDSYNFKSITDFYYSRGAAQTDVPWFRPDPHYMNKWKEDFFALDILEQYRFFLFGSARQQNLDTWDVDIFMTGHVKDMNNLELIMKSAIQLGFKNRQLIDISWCDREPKNFLKGPCNYRELPCNEYLENGTCTLEKCAANKNKVHKRIKYGNFTTKNNKIYDNFKLDTHDKLIEQDGNIQIIEQDGPIPPKIVNKMKNKEYKFGVLEITKDTDFREHILYP